MTWPNQGDYNQAIQNPRIAFRDPELRIGTAHANRLGPVPWSGQNAAVYKIISGAKAWAVKCFTHEVSDHQVRYGRISEHLAKTHLRYMVNFKFLGEGINVKGRWYPLVQMEWAEGERLNDYVRRHLSEPDKLQRLAQRVLQMVQDLRTAQIAHGDLQHGNILVCNEDLRLVDYDGLWVPALAGVPPAELGHPHYQHPARLRGATTHLDGSLDNFSLWVIVLGLYALSLDPSLWEQTGRGDDWLLFRDEDFQPMHSPLLSRLEGHADPNLRLWALGFRRLLFSAGDRVPFPDIPIPAPSATPVARAHRKADWIRGQQATTQGPAAEQRPPAPDRTWLLDHRRVQQPGRLRNPVSDERVLLAVSFVVLVVLVPIMGSIGFPSLLALLVSVGAMDCAFFISRHRAEPDVQRLVRVRGEAADFDTRLRLKERMVAVAQRDRRAQGRKAADEVARLRNEQRVLLERESGEAKATVETRDRQLVLLAERRERADLDEAQALDAVRRSSGLGGLDTEINKQQAALSSELQRALKPIQDQHLMDYLRGTAVDAADLKGIGTTLKERMLLAGFRTAAEIDANYGVGWRRVEGIGPAKNAVLVHWRRDLERAAGRSMPQALTGAQAAQIRLRYTPHIELLQKQKAHTETVVNSEMLTIKLRHANGRADLDKEVLAVQPIIDAELRAMRERYATQHKVIDYKVQRLEEANAEQIRETDARIMRIERELADLRFKREATRRELQGLETVTFGSYLRRVFVSAA